MNRSKLVILVILASLTISISSLPQNVSAYSTQTTGLSTIGFDNNQESYARVASYNIFAFDNKILFYDDNAVLQKTYNLPTLTNLSSVAPGYTPRWNGSRCSILGYDSATILISLAVHARYEYSGTDYEYMGFEWGFLSVNNLQYSVIYSGYKNLRSNTHPMVNYATYGLSAIILKNTNSSGDFYYGWSSAYINSGTTYYNELISYLGKNVGGIWTAGYSQKFSKTDDNYLRSSPIVIMLNNVNYVLTSNNFDCGVRANIYQINFAPFAINYIGVTPLDYTWAGSARINSVIYTGFVYLIGVGVHDSLVYVNYAFSENIGSELGLGTTYFNSTYLNTVVSHMAVSVGSTVVRPFTVGTPAQNSFGNGTGVYSLAYFDDITTYGNQGNKWYLHGWSLQDTNLVTPNWATYQFGFLFTPQQPTANYYYTATDWGGFQPAGMPIALFVDMTGGNAIASQVYNINSILSFNGMLTGGIFTNAIIAQAPTEVTLQQGITYTYTGNIFVNYALQGNGTFSVLASTFSQSPSIFLSYSLISSTSGSVINGVFSFTIVAQSASQVLYRVMQVNFTLNDGTQATYIYNFGYYGIGQTGDTGTPYPTPGGGGGGGGGGGSGGGGSGTLPPDQTIITLGNAQNFVYTFIVPFIIILAPGLILAMYLGLSGFLGGSVLGIGVGVTAGLIPPWLIIVMLFVLFAMLILRSRNQGGSSKEEG